MSNKVGFMFGMPVLFYDPHDPTQDNILSDPDSYYAISVNLVGSPSTPDQFLGQVGGAKTRATVEFPRPNDTSAYAAKDAVANRTAGASVLTFENMARVVGKGGYIVKAVMLTDQAANVASFRLHLFNAAPTAQQDNATFALLWAARASYLGFIDMGPLAQESTGSTAAGAERSSGVGALPLSFMCASGDKNLYGLLETLDVFTPAALQNFFVMLAAEVD